MKITNRFNLPEPFVAAVTGDDYVRGDADFTTTELITPTRILSLKRKHDADMIEDASERVWAMQGQMRHLVLERIAKTDPSRYLVEQRFESVMPGGIKVSGQIDLFDFKDGTLYDWKETSVWKFLIGDTTEWEQQANINLYLMRSNGMVVHALKNIAILKDWKIREARIAKLSKGKKDYPLCAIHVMDLPMWSIGQAQDFIIQKAKSHNDNMAKPPVCTKKERWQRDASFAVMRRDRKRAIPGGLCDSRDKAEAVMMHHMKIAPPGDAAKFYIEQRNAEPVRCLDFCAVQTYCDFGTEAEKRWREKHENELKE
jgi:hypothetical protein